MLRRNNSSYILRSLGHMSSGDYSIVMLHNGSRASILVILIKDILIIIITIVFIEHLKHFCYTYFLFLKYDLQKLSLI